MSESEIKDYVANLKNPKDPCANVTGKITDVSGEISRLQYQGIKMRAYKDVVDAFIYEIYSDYQFEISGMVSVTLDCSSINLCTGARNNWSYTANVYVQNQKVSITKKTAGFPPPVNSFTKWGLVGEKVVRSVGLLFKWSKYHDALEAAGKAIVSSPNLTCKATQPIKK
jgi:hypothetical protein